MVCFVLAPVGFDGVTTLGADDVSTVVSTGVGATVCVSSLWRRLGARLRVGRLEEDVVEDMVLLCVNVFAMVKCKNYETIE